MRLFAAIELSDAIRAASAAVLDELRRRAAAAGATLTWVDPSRMHLTVRFIGDVDGAQAARIRAALTPAIDVAPFDLTCRGLRVFPGPRRPRVIACGVAAGRDDVSRIEAVVSDRLEYVDVPREGRAYAPHVTLGRVRDAGRLRIEDLFAGLRNVGLGSTRVEAITLFESRVSSNGPTYTSLMQSSLAA